MDFLEMTPLSVVACNSIFLLLAPILAASILCISIVIAIACYVFKGKGRTVDRVSQSVTRAQFGNKIKAVKEFVAPSGGPRFRKRDRLAFMSRKALRNAQAAVGVYIRGGQGRKHRSIIRFARRMLLRESSEIPNSIYGHNFVRRPELPVEFLEEIGSDFSMDSMPTELKFVLRNMKVFGNFDDSIYAELLKDIQCLHLMQNSYLFKIGDPDVDMYIVESGAVNVYARDVDTPYVAFKEGSQNLNIDVEERKNMETGQNILLKTVRPGEPVMSLLSFLDTIAGKEGVFKSVHAIAIEESRVIKVSYQAFKNIFHKNPETLIHVVQAVMVRLQRVTLLALHKYLGLGSEFIDQSHKKHFKRDENTSQNLMAFTKCNLNSTLVTKKEKGEVALATSSISADLSEQENDTDIRTNKLSSDIKGSSLVDRALWSFIQLMSLEPMYHDQLRNSIIIYHVEKAHKFVEEDMIQAPESSNIILVLNGDLVVSQLSEQRQNIEVHRVYQGEIIGLLHVLTGEPSFFSITSGVPSTVALIKANAVFKLMQMQPTIALSLGLRVTESLSPYVRSIDFALEWLLVESGRALYKQDDVADCTYVVLSGRLRSVSKRNSDGKKSFVAEYGRGELTGIVETLTESNRSTTVIAVRDTEVVKLPSGLINSLKLKYPLVLLRLIKLLSNKLQRTWELGTVSSSIIDNQRACLPLNITANPSDNSFNSNISTVAVFSPTPDHVPLSAFTMELYHALLAIGPTVRLTESIVRGKVSPEIFKTISCCTPDYRLSSWLAHREDENRIVIYQCSEKDDAWTNLCIRHADVILVVVDGKQNPSVRKEEELLAGLSKRTRKEMIFLHRNDVVCPSGTGVWLRQRAWINSHYHIKCPSSLFVTKSEKRLQTIFKNKIDKKIQPDCHSDFSRLARMLTGTSVGLVLGGGGARGCSHVGMIKAIHEFGMPIDTVAGVSIGAFMGALWCQERDVGLLTEKAQRLSTRMSQWWRQIPDLTYPYTSMLTGNAFNGFLMDIFSEERDIEDLWLPYFTISTDITDSAMRIHDYGSLWRYVRSSMSLAGYLPPLCDPFDGHLLLDGGYTNNLPADVMRLRGASHILAIDVGMQTEASLSNYGDSLSGWNVLWRKWNPFCTSLKVPDQVDIQSRLAYVSCMRQLEIVKNSDFCDYIRPPIDKFSNFQFGSFDEINNIGYFHGSTYFKGLMKAGQMQQFHWKNSVGTGNQFNLPIVSPLHDKIPIEPVLPSLSSDDVGHSSSTSVDEDIDSEHLISDEEEDTASGFFGEQENSSL